MNIHYQTHQETAFLRHIKEVTREIDTSRVNQFLKSGWILLAIEQQDLDYKMTTTFFVLGHPEGNAS